MGIDIGLEGIAHLPRRTIALVRGLILFAAIDKREDLNGYPGSCWWCSYRYCNITCTQSIYHGINDRRNPCTIDCIINAFSRCNTAYFCYSIVESAPGLAEVSRRA